MALSIGVSGAVSRAEARIAMPLIKREIIYQLLTSGQEGRLSHLTI